MGVTNLFFNGRNVRLEARYTFHLSGGTTLYSTRLGSPPGVFPFLASHAAALVSGGVDPGPTNSTPAGLQKDGFAFAVNFEDVYEPAVYTYHSAPGASNGLMEVTTYANVSVSGNKGGSWVTEQVARIPLATVRGFPTSDIFSKPATFIEEIGAQEWAVDGEVVFFWDMVETGLGYTARTFGIPQIYDVSGTARVAIGGKDGGRRGYRGRVNGQAFSWEGAITLPASLSGGVVNIPSDLIATADAGASARASLRLQLGDATGGALSHFFTAPGISYKGPEGYGTCDDGAGGIYAEGGLHPITVHVGGVLPRRFRVVGKLFTASGEPYKGALPITVVSGDPRFTGGELPGYYRVSSSAEDGSFETPIFVQPGVSGLILGAFGSYITGDPGTVYAGLFPGAALPVVTLQVKAADLAARGLHPNSAPVQFRAWRWPALRLRQAPAVFVDSGAGVVQPGGPYGGKWTPIGAAEGPKAPQSGSVGVGFKTPGSLTAEAGLRRSFDAAAGAWLSSYRTLTLKMRSIGRATAPFKLRIGNKVWYASTGAQDGAWSDVAIDLCEEVEHEDKTPLPAWNKRDSIRWWKDGNPDALEAKNHPDMAAENSEAAKAIREGGPAPDRPAESAYFGVNRAAAIDILGLVPDVTYEVQTISLTRAKTPRLTVQSAFRPEILPVPTIVDLNTPYWLAMRAIWGHDWPDMDASSTPVHYRRLLMADTDGRMSLEEADTGYLHAGGSVSAAQFTISQIARMVEGKALTPTPAVGQEPAGRNPGWTCTDLAPIDASTGGPLVWPRASAICNDQLAVCLWGNGVLIDGGGFRHGANVEIPDNGLTVPAQIVAGGVDWWPGAGDPFGMKDNGFGEVMTLYATGIVAGGAHNLIVGDAVGDYGSGSGQAETVRLKETESRLLGGAGVAEEAGRYTTGAPGALSVSRKAEGAGNPSFYPPYPTFYDVVLDGDPDPNAAGDMKVSKKDKAAESRTAPAVFFEAGRLHRVAIAAQAHPAVAMVRDRLLGWYGVAVAHKWGVTFRRTKGAGGLPRTSADRENRVVVTAAAAGEATFAHVTISRQANATLRLRWERRTPPPGGGTSSGPWARSVWESLSYDDGGAWEEPKAVLITGVTGARQPELGQGLDGDLGLILAAVFVADPDTATGGDADPGTLVGQMLSQGDMSPEEHWTFTRLDQPDGAGGYLPLMVVAGQGGYRLLQASDPYGSWLLTCTVDGEAQPSEWVSADGREWRRLPA